jgi:hypothetical protein
MLYTANENFAWLFPASLLILVRAEYRILRRIAEINELRRNALSVTGKAPDPDSDEVQPVNWWEMYHAGFRAKKLEKLWDENWKLSGRPWFFLYHGSLLIPVFRQHRPTEHLYPQHFVRMAAYCHLVETCVGKKTPYGIIIFGRTYDGVAIPNSPASRKAFHDELVKARRVVTAAHRDDELPDAPAPDRSNLCFECPIGRPTVWDGGDSDCQVRGVPVPVCPAKGVGRRLYHSRCGDRFGWLPPHIRAKEKELKLVEEGGGLFRWIVSVFSGRQTN